MGHQHQEARNYQREIAKSIIPGTVWNTAVWICVGLFLVFVSKTVAHVCQLAPNLIAVDDSLDLLPPSANSGIGSTHHHTLC